MKYVLAIDQGTTSTRAILFDAAMQPVATEQMEFTQHFPKSGWVEHDPNDLLNTTLKTCKDVIANHGITADDVTAIGITNQRETTLVWDKTTGKAVHNAIVWQDRRTAPFCAELKAEGFESEITHRTGLLADPYFSGTKLRHILQTQDNSQNLLFGTVDSFLIWHLTEGRVHATDATNASRTMLYNIRVGAWDEVICTRFDIPMHMLPDVRDCAADFGSTTLFGGNIPILGVAGDQQAATIGQACFDPGMMKSTYGTGCFALLNTGDTLVTSQNRLLGTIAYQFNGQPTYALEGSIFVAGAVVQWLRDGLKLLANAPESQPMAEAADPEQNLYMVPAFTGLGAPYWDADSRGAIFGLTRNSGPNEFARAALESVGYQTRDLIEAMHADGAPTDGENVLRVDGGMAASDWTMQFLSDILGAAVDRPHVLETTALGAAWLAGMRAGLYPTQDEFAKTWTGETRFTPKMDGATRDAKYAGWQDAIKRTLTT
ncbi:glycerol kinase GlpK [Amylibacter sp. IMCC11727]|uniref:glycerol kinase GlpK n=1 Tax=Amylibacter sp. IMCC11727 TaxID=3039851 RepID=UPI00244DA547|nr:glycerol kinase GlpK [Amylibacter sp. IMCC11727]WGI22680.1 glycerol kinase GlpK [Amylibacter sp. IMCC11727]